LAGGRIAGATINPTNGIAMIVSSGTLDGVTVNGDLDLTANGANATVLNGLVLNGTARLGSQTNANTYGYVSFAGSQTLAGNGTVVFGQHGCNQLGVQNGGTTLTLGPGLVVRGHSRRVGDGNGPC